MQIGERYLFLWNPRLDIYIFFSYLKHFLQRFLNVILKIEFSEMIILSYKLSIIQNMHISEGHLVF